MRIERIIGICHKCSRREPFSPSTPVGNSKNLKLGSFKKEFPGQNVLAASLGVVI